MADLSLRRTQMGRAATAMLVMEGAENEVCTGSWLGLSGLPTADMNMALIHEDDDAALAHVLSRIQERGCPALLMLAGDGINLAGRLPEPWTAVGAMPIMTVDVAAAAKGPDTRVRCARPADAAVVTRLISEAYGMEPGHVDVMVAGVLTDESVVDFWLLEDGGQPVSTVLTGRVDETVSLWCMATPPQFARRGYGRALLAAVLHWAGEDGASVGLLGATPAGEPLYRVTGWEVAEHWHIHLNASSVQFA
jgi:GNAT superfamily N-acetyltransferase